MALLGPPSWQDIYPPDELWIVDQAGKLIEGPWHLDPTDIIARALAQLRDRSLLVAGMRQENNGAIFRGVIRRCLPNGLIDPEFGRSLDREGYIWSALVLADGTFLVGGYFGLPDSATLLRFMADGTRFTDFTPLRGLRSNGLIAEVYSLALDPDGKVLAGGSFDSVEKAQGSGLVRIASNGVIDTDFRSSLQPGSAVEAISILPDRKILIAGRLVFSGEAPVAIARLTSEGARDPAFISPSISMSSTRRAIGLGVDSKSNIVLSGPFDSVNGAPYGGIVRLYPDGFPDPNFAAFDRSLVGKFTSYILIGPDDSIYSLGSRFLNGIDLGTPRLFGGSPAPFPPMPLSNPSVQTFVEGSVASFGVTAAGFPAPSYRWVLNGTNLTGITNQGFTIHSISRAQQGVLSVEMSNTLGSVTQQVATIIVNSSKKIVGGNDVLFRIDDPTPVKVYAMVLASDGTFLLVGTSSTEGDQIVRFDASGDRLTEFGAKLHLTGIPGLGSVSLLPRNTGEILVGGSFDRVNGQPRRNLARLTRTGELDPTFLDLGGASSNITAVLELEGGRTLVAGDFETIQGVKRQRVAALNRNGTVDESFLPPVFDAGAQVRQLLPDSNGGVIVAGRWREVDGTPRGALIRLNSHGALDPDYFSSVVATSVVAAATSDGRVVATWVESGTPGPLSTIRRFTPEGSLDSSFALGDSIRGEVSELVVDGQGRVLVAGAKYMSISPPVYRQLMRFRADGSFDTNLTSGTSTFASINVTRLLVATQQGRFATLEGAQVRMRLGDVDATAPPSLPARLYPSQALPGGPGALALPGEGENLKWTWMFNGRAMPGGSSGYSKGVTQPADFGEYYAIVTNAFGAVTSSVARLEVGSSAPIIVKDSTELPVVFPSSDVTLSVTASGTAPIHFQWYHDRVAMPGETRASLLLPSVRAKDGGVYQLVAWSEIGEAHSTPAFVQVLPEPFLSPALDRPNVSWSSDAPGLWKVETNDTSDGVDAVEIGPLASPGTTWMQTRVAGPGTLKFFWKVSSLVSTHQLLFYVRNTPGFPFSQSHISARSNEWVEASVVIPPGTKYPTWQLERLPETPLGNVKGYLDQVRFIPDQPSLPTLLRQPESVTLIPGGVLKLSVGWSSATPATFQWRRGGFNLPGETRAVIERVGVTEVASGDYEVVVTNDSGSVVSEIAHVSVTSEAMAIPTPRLVSAEGFEFQWTQAPGRDVIIEASENLKDWFDPNIWIWPVTGNVVRMTDLRGLTEPHRFYRGRTEP